MNTVKVLRRQNISDNTKRSNRLAFIYLTVYEKMMYSPVSNSENSFSPRSNENNEKDKGISIIRTYFITIHSISILNSRKYKTQPP